MTSLFLGRPSGALRFTYHAPILRRCIHNKYLSRDKARGHPPDHMRPSTFSEITEPEAEIWPGDHVYAVCKEHDIALPSVNRPQKKVKLSSNPCKLTIAVFEQHCIDKFSMQYLDRYEHPFAKSVLNMYIAQKNKPLWFKASSLPTASPFPCRTAAKRIRHAFYDALASHGYDREGRRIVTDNNSSIVAYLYGTVRITTADPRAVCNIKFAEIVEQANKIVSDVEMALARDKNGRSVTSTRQQPARFNSNKQQPKPQWKPSGKFSDRKRHGIDTR